MIDLHCHLLPYVDDGAHDLDEAAALLRMEAEQGITTVCVTPHLRQGMFETPDEKIRRQYERLSELANGMGIKLYLSREYHYDGLFREKLRAGELIPLGGNTVLTEFSAAHSAEQMLFAVKEMRSNGYTPLIAHVERYPAADAQTVEALRAAGALIQVNADAVLGYDGRYAKKLAWSLLKANLVDVIASDAHSTEERPPRLAQCYKKIEKKLGAELASSVTESTPARILAGISEEN